jgi:hypothetical protein
MATEFSSDGQYYVRDSEASIYRVSPPSSQKKDAKRARSKRNRTPVVIRHILSLRCSTCRNISEVTLMSGSTYQCQHCSRTYPWADVLPHLPDHIDYSFSEVRDDVVSPDRNLTKIFEKKLKEKYIYGRNEQEDLHQASLRLSNRLSLHIGRFGDDYFFLSQFLTYRYGRSDMHRLELNCFFLYYLFRGFEAFPEGWSAIEVMRASRKILAAISDDTREYDGSEAGILSADQRVVAGSLVILVLSRLARLEYFTDAAMSIDPASLTNVLILLRQASAGRLELDPNWQLGLRFIAANALLSAAFENWIPEQAAGFVALTQTGLITQILSGKEPNAFTGRAVQRSIVSR